MTKVAKFATGNGLSQDRLVRKEVALGVIREFEPPQDHIGLSLFAPFYDVQSDDVIFNYTRGLTAGLAPARAEDAESELAGKDESSGTGRASIIDWALKDHYDPSDVTRWRQANYLNNLAGTDQNLSLALGSMTEDWVNMIARDTLLRRKKIDNRLEWLIMKAMDTGKISYNDGRIIFDVDYGRPTAQQDFLPPSTGNAYWSATGADPVEDLLITKADAKDVYGIDLNQAIISTKVWRNMRRTSKFIDALTGANPLYKVSGWGDQAAADFISSQTDVNFIIYDSVYRTRSLGSNTTVNNKFMRDNVVLLFPSNRDLGQLDDAIGFGKMLTSPHAEGNFTPGYYEWERDTVDPWSHDMGTGIKAFPVFPHLDLSYVMKVLA